MNFLYNCLSVIFLLPFTLFNPKNIVGILDGSRIDITRVAVLNLQEYRSNRAQQIGLAASLASIILYVIFYSFIFKFTRARIAKHKL